MAKEIVVEIPLEGSPTITVNGVKGKSCKDLTASLEKALGKTIKSVETKEYYEKPLKASVRVNQ